METLVPTKLMTTKLSVIMLLPIIQFVRMMLGIIFVLIIILITKMNEKLFLLPVTMLPTMILLLASLLLMTTMLEKLLLLAMIMLTRMILLIVLPRLILSMTRMW